MSVSGFGPMLWGWFCGVIGVVFALSGLIFFMYLRKRGQTIRDDMSTFVSQEKFEAKYGSALANERQRLFEQSVGNRVKVCAQSMESDQTEYQINIIKNSIEAYFRKQLEFLLELWLETREKINRYKEDPINGINDGYHYGGKPTQSLWQFSAQRFCNPKKNPDFDHQYWSRTILCHIIWYQFEVFRRCGYPASPLKDQLICFVEKWFQKNPPNKNSSHHVQAEYERYSRNHHKLHEKYKDYFRNYLAIHCIDKQLEEINISDARREQLMQAKTSIGALLDSFEVDEWNDNMGLESIYCVAVVVESGFCCNDCSCEMCQELGKLYPCFRNYLSTTELGKELERFAAITAQIRRLMSNRFNPFRDMYSDHMSHFVLDINRASMEQAFIIVSTMECIDVSEESSEYRYGIKELVLRLALCDIYANAPVTNVTSLSVRRFNNQLDYFADNPKKRYQKLNELAKEHGKDKKFFIPIPSFFNYNGLHSNAKLTLMDLGYDCSKEMVVSPERLSLQRTCRLQQQIDRLDVIIRRAEALQNDKSSEEVMCMLRKSKTGKKGVERLERLRNLEGTICVFRQARINLANKLDPLSFDEYVDSTTSYGKLPFFGQPSYSAQHRTNCPSQDKKLMKLLRITNGDWDIARNAIFLQPHEKTTPLTCTPLICTP